MTSTPQFLAGNCVKIRKRWWAHVARVGLGLHFLWCCDGHPEAKHLVIPAGHIDGAQKAARLSTEHQQTVWHDHPAFCAHGLAVWVQKWISQQRMGKGNNDSRILPYVQHYNPLWSLAHLVYHCSPAHLHLWSDISRKHKANREHDGRGHQRISLPPLLQPRGIHIHYWECAMAKFPESDSRAVLSWWCSQCAGEHPQGTALAAVGCTR